MHKKLIVANWKNHPNTWGEAEQILESINDYLESRGENRELSLVICPPPQFLEKVSEILKISHLEHQAELGAQDIDASGKELNKLGIKYVITGHSDRRWGLGESDETVNKKIKEILANEMIPVVCIGEKTRYDNYKEFIERQIKATFAGMSADDIGKCVIAYEPVWAISTSPDARPDTPENAVEMIDLIKKTLIGDPLLMIYGGSVNPQNVNSFLESSEIGGVIVGGASIRKEDFISILSKV